MTEGMVEVDMRAGRGLCWSDVAADIEAGNPVEASAAEPDPLEHYRQRWVVGTGGAEPLGVTPAGDLVFPSQVVGVTPWMI